MNQRLKNVLIFLPIILFILLSALSFEIFSEKQDLKFQLLREKYIPDIELSNSLDFNYDGLAVGSASGFVAFINEKDQPKNTQQYYVIEALNKFDNDSQLFLLEEIIKFQYIPPHKFDKILLRVKSDTNNLLVLEDVGGNSFNINKITREIRLLDATGDSTYLITSDSEYEKFMRNFLK